jgi:Fe-S cluster assembly scaffold protein SufB
MEITQPMTLSRNFFSNFLNKCSEPDSFRLKRSESFQEFCSLENPSFRYGLTSKLKCGFTFDSITPEDILEDRDLISLTGGTLSPLSSLSGEELGLLNSKNNDRFDAFNSSLFKNGNLIRINKTTDDPVIINKSLLNKVHVGFVLVIVESGVRCNIIDEVSSNERTYLCSNKVIVIAKPDSKILFTSIQQLSDKTFGFIKKEGILLKNSRIEWKDLYLGGSFVRSMTYSNLLQENSSVDTKSLYLGGLNQQFDVVIGVTHNAPNTTCDLNTRMALLENSKAVYRGNIKIPLNSSNSKGYQKSDILLLSDDACADSIPQLEIKNHNVKCTHGSTIGFLDKEKLFYLMSRGLTEKQSIAELVKGFFVQISKNFDSKEVRERITKEIVEKLK